MMEVRKLLRDSLTGRLAEEKKKEPDSMEGENGFTSEGKYRIKRNCRNVKPFLKIIRELKILVPIGCPFLEYLPSENINIENLTKIERMRLKAVKGELPVRVARIADSESESPSPTSNTPEGEKPSQKRFTGHLRESLTVPKLSDCDMSGQRTLRREFAEEVVRKEMKKCERVYTDARTGYTSTYKGNVWYSAYRNFVSRSHYEERWEEWKPEIRQAYLVTLTPYNEDFTGNWSGKISDLSEGVQKLLKRIKRRCGTLNFWGLEFSGGSSLHAHCVIASRDESYNLYEDLIDILESSAYNGKSDVRKWDINADVSYLIKSLSNGVDRMHAKLDRNESLDENDLNDLTIYKLSSDSGIKFFGYPRGRTEKGEVKMRAQTNERHGLRRETAREIETIGRAVGLSNKQDAQELFTESPCRTCDLDCPISRWVKKYVFGDNSLQYKDLESFIKDGA